MNRLRSLLFAQKPANLRVLLCNSAATQRRSFTNLVKSDRLILNNGKFPQTAAVRLRKYTTEADANISDLDYGNFCAETLDDLTDYIEELVESTSKLETADVVNKDGVLTVSLGPTHGTYVINKQTPNKQIWLSSPTSGPKRYDFVYASNDTKRGYWIYRHTGETLHEMLDKEFTAILADRTKFQSLAFGLKC